MIGLPASDFTPEKIWILSQAKNGQVTASENGLRLHSAYNPEREAAGAVSVEEISKKSATVFYGFGLGYHLVEWCKNHQEKNLQKKKLLVVEPEINHFFAAMMMIDWTSVFAHENLVLALACPPEAVLGLLESSDKINLGDTGVSDAYYFDIPPFTAHAKPYFDGVKAIIKRNQRKNEINAATLKKFGRLWVRNSLKNLDYLAENDDGKTGAPGGASLNWGGIGIFENKASKNLPFLIVGAGPSLEKFLPYAKFLASRFVIVCVETALKALVRVGLQPDFVILTDPQFWAYRHIAGLSSPSSFLITDLSAYPAVFRFDCKKILLCSSQFPVAAYFEKKLGLAGQLGDLGTGGSVASSAWNFAYFSGAKKIYTVGLDFSFPGKQTHIKGSSAEQTYHTISNRLFSADYFTAKSLFSANAVMAEDYSGKPLLTDSRMKMFSWWFEARLAKCPDVQTFTLSPQGLKTPGILVSDWEDVLALPEVGKEKAEFFGDLTTGAENLTPGADISGVSRKLTPRAGVPEVSLTSPQLSEKIRQVKKDFPSQGFLSEYPFLKEYL